MFTGIIVAVGEILQATPTRLIAHTQELIPELEIGSSIAINGACMTVIELHPAAASFAVEITPETFQRTNLSSLRHGDLVNLELPLLASARFDGHFVLGHVDTLGEVISISRTGHGIFFRFRVDKCFSRYLIEKGSIALDGVSLTIFNISDGGFDVAVIPYTLQETNLRTRRPGDTVNIEFDLLGKYIEKLLETKGGR